MNKKLNINDIYEGKLSVLYNPFYAPHDTFIGLDDHIFFFKKIDEESYEEVFTESKFSTKENNKIKEFKPTIMNISPIDKNHLNKIQLKTGNITLYGLSKLYNMKNNKPKTKIKVIQ